MAAAAGADDAACFAVAAGLACGSGAIDIAFDLVVNRLLHIAGLKIVVLDRLPTRDIASTARAFRHAKICRGNARIGVGWDGCRRADLGLRRIAASEQGCG